jgi:hypothetical protein
MNPAEEVIVRRAFDPLAGQYLALVMAQQSDYFEASLRDEFTPLVNRVIERVIDQQVERLAAQAIMPTERSEERSVPAPAIPTPAKADKN